MSKQLMLIDNTEQFRRLPGLTRFPTENGPELLVPVPAFEAAFRNATQHVRDLRAGGIIKGSGGTKPEGSIHAPRRFRNGVRVTASSLIAFGRHERRDCICHIRRSCFVVLGIRMHPFAFLNMLRRLWDE